MDTVTVTVTAEVASLLARLAGLPTDRQNMVAVILADALKLVESASETNDCA